MKKPDHKYETMEIPRLDAEIKKMNGKSTRRLHQCIDKLDHLLEDDEAVREPPRCPAEPPKED